MQSNRSCKSCPKINQERLTGIHCIILVNLVDDGGTHEFIKEYMGNPAEVTFVEAKNSLFVQARNTFPIRLIDWSAVNFVEADLP